MLPERKWVSGRASYVGSPAGRGPRPAECGVPSHPTAGDPVGSARVLSLRPGDLWRCLGARPVPSRASPQPRGEGLADPDTTCRPPGPSQGAGRVWPWPGEASEGAAHRGPRLGRSRCSRFQGSRFCCSAQACCSRSQPRGCPVGWGDVGILFKPEFPDAGRGGPAGRPVLGPEVCSSHTRGRLQKCLWKGGLCVEETHWMCFSCSHSLHHKQHTHFRVQASPQHRAGSRSCGRHRRLS